MTYQIAQPGAEDSIHFTADMTMMNDEESAQRDIVIRHGGPVRTIVITLKDVENEAGEQELEEIHIDSTGLPPEQLAFILHETSHMMHESNKEEELRHITNSAAE